MQNLGSSAILMFGFLILQKLKCAESGAGTQQHLHKQSAEAVVVGQIPDGSTFSI